MSLDSLRVRRRAYAASNITAVNDNIASARNESLSYDALNRLTNATGAYGNIDFGYDLVGNRTLRRINGTGGVTETYSYPGSSNRLSSVSDGTNTRSFSYSAAGNVTGDDPPGSLNYALAYNDNDRLATVNQSGTQLASYSYDADEHRIVKQVFGSGGYTHHFQYDQDGHLIAESDSTGTVIREYLWLGALPIAVVDGGTLYFIHTDWRGAPQKATNSSRTVVWDAQIQPFGEVYAVSGALTQLLKFPGQHHDGETGYDDNWHRAYDAATGRYLQADPLGLCKRPSGGVQVA